MQKQQQYANKGPLQGTAEHDGITIVGKPNSKGRQQDKSEY